MKDQYKTKKQLIEELEVLRNQLVGPKKAEANRIHAEEALRESEATLRALINAPTDSVLLLDTRGVILDLNKIAAERLGKSRDELIGTLADDSLPEDIAERRRSIISQILETSREVRFEDERDGIWYDTVVHPITDKDGEVSRLAIIARDITERKQMEEQLRESELRYRELFENSGTSVVIVDQHGKYLLVNQIAAKTFGKSPEEVIGKSMFDFLAEATAHKYLEAYRKLVETGGRREYEDTFMLPGGEKTFLIVDRCLKDVTSHNFAIQSSAIDITQRKQTEAALRETKERFSTIFHASPVSIVTTRLKDSQIIDVNNAWQKTTGFTREEAIGHTPIELNSWVNPGDRDRLISKLREQGAVQDFEFQLRHKSGIVYDMLMSADLIELAGERYMLSLTQDITERKRTEEKIHTYQEQLRSLSSELSLIEERERRHIATDLHDHIGHNLAIIKIKLGALREMAFPSGPIGPVDEIQNLIEQAIHYTRSLTSELSPPVLYELGFEAAVEWLTEQIQDQHHIQVDFEDDRQFKPMSDEIRISLFKAVRELLINIAKHSRAHKAKVSTRREDNIIRIIVEDDGVGFSIPEDKSLTKIGGFGLFNVHERLKYLKGDFEIDSKPGQGTRITLVAPLTKEENDNRSVT